MVFLLIVEKKQVKTFYLVGYVCSPSKMLKYWLWAFLAGIKWSKVIQRTRDMVSAFDIVYVLEHFAYFITYNMAIL